MQKKYIYKGRNGFSKFKNAKEYLEYRKYAERTLLDRSKTLENTTDKFDFNHDGLREALLTKKKPQRYNHIKGSIELGSLAGSILGLAIIAPNVSQALTHGFLKLIGLEQKK